MIAPKFLSAIVPALLTALYLVLEYLATKDFCTCWKEEEEEDHWMTDHRLDIPITIFLAFAKVV